MAFQANRGVKSVRENKREQEIQYTLTIGQASAKDSGSYACAITDIISDKRQTRELVINVYGNRRLRGGGAHSLVRFLDVCGPCRSLPHLISSSSPSAESAFVSLRPSFSPQETAELDEVREFRADIDSFPEARVTWLKDGRPLDDVAAEISSNLRKVGETR